MKGAATLPWVGVKRPLWAEITYRTVSFRVFYVYQTFVCQACRSTSSSTLPCTSLPVRKPCQEISCPEYLLRLPSRHAGLLTCPGAGGEQDSSPVPRPVSPGSVRPSRRCPDRPKPGPRSGRVCQGRLQGRGRPDPQVTAQRPESQGADDQWHRPEQR